MGDDILAEADRFLATADIAALTGRKWPSKQIETLRTMNIPFFVNALGRPVVTVAAIEGGKAPAPKKLWSPPPE